MNRVFSFVLALVLLVGIVPVAHAEGEVPDIPAVSGEEVATIPEVSTLEELQAAIEQAEAGDTIRITRTIYISNLQETLMLGSEDKPLTLCAAEDVNTMLVLYGTWDRTSYCFLSGFTFDGGGITRDTLMWVDFSATLYMNNVHFMEAKSDSYGAALRVTQGFINMSYGSFVNCISDLGGAVYVDIGGRFISSDTTFTDNTATRDGGAIYTLGTTEVSDCTLTGNTSTDGSGGAVAGLNYTVFRSTLTRNTAQKGGGVYMIGGGSIREAKIYNNTAALAGADLFSEGAVTISVEDDNYTAQAGVYETSPKNGRQRTVDVGPEVLALLAQLREEQAGNAISKWVFTQDNSPEPMFPQSPTRYFKKFEKRHGVADFHPHKLRHTSASLAITNGADVVSVSERMGHSDPSTTLRMYSHANEESIRRAGQIARDAIKAQGN